MNDIVLSPRFATSANWLDGIVAILNRKNRTVGTGFVVHQTGLIVTCAHIINDHLGTGPGDQVMVRFRVNGLDVPVTVTTWWRDKTAEDVAILRLHLALPDEVVVLPLAAATGSENHSFSTFGYHQTSQIEAIFGRGEIRGLVSEKGISRLQLRAHEISHGFSGAPVWDETWNCVVGIVQQGAKPDHQGRLLETSFAIPSETLESICPNLQFWSPAPIPLNIQRRRDFYEHVNLPTHYLPRPQLLAAVREVLLTAAAPIGIPSRVKRNALHGMGGVGKTVLARSLCDDGEIQAAFPDGILWATLGQTPDIVARLREWIERLGGIIAQSAPTLRQLKNTLIDLLKERTCLLIVDDVWKMSDVEWFQVDGLACRLLLTTRDAGLAHELGAMVHPLELMEPNEAIVLLQAWAKGSLQACSSKKLEEIATRLGRLPLALKLAGAQLRTINPKIWLETFHISRLQAHRSESPHDNLLQTFVLSLNTLTTEERGLYVALSIFRDDEDIPLVGIVTLWQGLVGWDEVESQIFLAHLRDLALLEWPNTHSNVSLHDLLREMMTEDAGSDGQIDAHRNLLNVYRSRQTGKGWNTVPDDGYLYRHLAYHLEALAVQDKQALAEILGLFANDRWIQVRVVSSDYLYDGYLADLKRAYRLVHIQTEKEITVNQPPVTLLVCLRFCLIFTTINSLATRVISDVPELVAQAVRLGVWTPARAVSFAQRVPDAKRRFAWLTILLTSDQLKQHNARTQRVARNLKSEDEELYIGSMITQVASKIEEELGDTKHDIPWYNTINDPFNNIMSGHVPLSDHKLAIDHALIDIPDIRDENVRANVLITLLPYLSRFDHLDQVINMSQNFQDESCRIRLLVILIPYITQPAQLTRVLNIVQNIKEEKKCTWLLSSLVPRLAEANLVTEALKIIHDFKDREQCVRTLASVAQNLTKPDQVVQALTVAQDIGDRRDMVLVLIALISHLDDEERSITLECILSSVRGISDDRMCALALVALAANLTEFDQLTEILNIIHGIKDESYCTYALVAFAPHVMEKDLPLALSIIQNLKEIRYRIEATTALSILITIPAYITILTETLTEIQGLNEFEFKTAALLKLIPRVAETKLLSSLLDVARTITDNNSRLQILTALIPHLTETDRISVSTEAFAIAQKLGPDRWHIASLMALADHLKGVERTTVLIQAFNHAQEIKNVRLRAYALAPMISHLSGVDRTTSIVQVVSTILGIKRERERVFILGGLIPQLTETELLANLSDELLIIRNIEDEGLRASALCILVPYLHDTRAFDEVFNEVRALNPLYQIWVWLAYSKNKKTWTFAQKILLQNILKILYELHSQKRSKLLNFLSTKGLLENLGLPTERLSIVSQDIVEICLEWRWL